MDGAHGHLPGADLVDRGIADLRAGRETEAALLVAMAAPRLRLLGVDVPARSIPAASHRLYELLAGADPAGVHSRYNALVARVVSFARAAENATPG